MEEKKPSCSDQLLACQFHRWYPHFRRHSIRSCIVPLPAKFIRYLEADGVRLPNELVTDEASSSDAEDQEDESTDLPSGSESTDLSDDGGGGDDSDADVTEGEEEDLYSFPRLMDQMHDALKHIGGKAFCKLNWSAPLDASWIAVGNSMACHKAKDVCLLLSASQRTQSNIDALAGQRMQPYLVLRAWSGLRPCNEFRVFVRNHKPVAICQRSASAHQHLQDEDIQRWVIHRLICFINRHVTPAIKDLDARGDIYREWMTIAWLQSQRLLHRGRDDQEKEFDVQVPEFVSLDESPETRPATFHTPPVDLLPLSLGGDYCVDLYISGDLGMLDKDLHSYESGDQVIEAPDRNEGECPVCDASGSVYVLDFSPFSADHTDPLLFTWQELKGANSTKTSGENRSSESKGEEQQLQRPSETTGHGDTVISLAKQVQFRVLSDREAQFNPYMKKSDTDEKDVEGDGNYLSSLLAGESSPSSPTEEYAQRRTVQGVLNRMPMVDGIDVSSREAIARFVAMCEALDKNGSNPSKEDQK